MKRKCKHGDEYCGSHYTCGRCAREENRAAFNRLTPEQKAYDNFVDPLNAYHDPRGYRDDDEGGCSCHINPPCSFCVRETG